MLPPLISVLGDTPGNFRVQKKSIKELPNILVSIDDLLINIVDLLINIVDILINVISDFYDKKGKILSKRQQYRREFQKKVIKSSNRQWIDNISVFFLKLEEMAGK